MSRTIPKRAGFHVFLLACSVTIASGQRVNADAQHIADFQQRVAAYVKLRNEAAAGMPGQKPTDSPGKMNNQERELAQKIRSLRPSARKGDIFTPEITAQFRRMLSPELKGDDGRDAKAIIKDDAPTNITFKVNAKYPEGAPVPTVPASLLVNLPTLPEPLQFRIIEKHLVLVDEDADVIVDYALNIIK